jgi:hypothetical protein
MRSPCILVTSVLLACNSLGVSQAMDQIAQPVHLSTRFDFEVDAPFSKTALLFGPESEKSWAGEHWKPIFSYPQPGKDTEGAVFTVAHGAHTSIWVNTLYDVAGGRMQYVAIIPQVVATVVDVKLTSLDASKTRVDVTYTRTALDPAANSNVRDLARHDSVSGPEWGKAIRTSLSGPDR